MDTTWQDAIAAARPLVVKISTPTGSGTGFLLYRSNIAPVCAIATAAHVVDEAHYWEQPIRIDHFSSERSALVRYESRGIILDEARDTAVIVVGTEELPLAEK